MIANSHISDEEQMNLLNELQRKETEYMRLKRHKISVEDFDLLTIIGREAFGEVRLCREKISGKIYAMKKLKKSEMVSRGQKSHKAQIISDSEESGDDNKPKNSLKKNAAYAGKQNGKDARDEKYVVEGVKDKKNGSGRDEPDEPKPHGRDKNRRREVENSSDSDSSKKHVKGTKKKYLKDSESDCDKNVKVRKQHDSDDDLKPNTQKGKQALRSRKNDSSDSSDEGPTYKTQKMKQPSRSKWHDSDDGLKHKSPKKKHSRNRWHDIDDEYSSDYGPKHETLKEESAENLKDNIRNNERRINSERRYIVDGKHGQESDTDPEKATKKERGKLDKSRRRHDTVLDELDADNVGRDRKTCNSRRHDSDDDNLHDVKSDDSSERSRESDLDSESRDLRFGRRETAKSPEKKRSGHRDDFSGRSREGEEKDLLPFKLMMGRNKRIEQMGWKCSRN
ncbi:Uncharacterized protein Adt_10371 [Abeliophyllum distichum]|uniref:Uncharacterized protein n=1 Tax=Abeliophyllum distichum TaxID=126358 RepID=A0ABD1UJZ6_9LAMI